MPLTVAMALSGLEPDHWNGELKQMYDQGASVVGKTYPNSPSVSSETSETTSYYSTESGISSMSPQSSVPLSPKDVHNIYLELMAKLEELINIDNGKYVQVSEDTYKFSLFFLQVLFVNRLTRISWGKIL